MDISVLIDNRAGTSGLAWEHGLSLCFQSDGLLWLFDTGASGKFRKNRNKYRQHRQLNLIART